MDVPFLLRLYALTTAAAAIAMPLWLRRRISIGKESPTRWRERYGETLTAKPSSPIIWCHAASVGETASVLPLVKALAARGHAILLTTGTVSSEQLVREQLPKGVVHQFAPLDHRPWIGRFLDHWQPKLALRVDSDLWPNTIGMLRQRRIPIIQINARISDAAAQRWARVPKTAQSLFSSLDLVLAQSEGDRARYALLGAKQAFARGNLKLSQPELPYDPRELAKLSEAVNARPIWLAASIHPGEDRIVGAAHRSLQSQHSNPLLIVVPRHPERAPEMATNLHAQGLTVARRSKSEPMTSDTNVYLADTMGELGLFYRLSKIVFIGKSFAVGGGQNPAEAAQLGCALMWGPDMSNFTEIAADLKAQGAAMEISEPCQLGDAVSTLLSDGAQVVSMTNAGQRFISASRRTLDQILDDLAPYLKQAVIR
jgi:3-deoxy-D-manno-octulosonic-acid transferase